MPVFYNNWDPILAASTGYESITVAGTAMTLNIPEGASACRIQFIGDAANTAATKAISTRMDGTAPTAGTGHIFGDLDFLELSTFVQMRNFKAIQYEASKTNYMRVQYFYNN